MVPAARSTGGNLTVARHAFVVGLIGALCLSPSLLKGLSPYDGGLAGSAGTFILHGSLPYRDFWWLYGPGAPIAVALPTLLFGPSLLLIRLLGLVVLGAQVAIGYALLRERLPHIAATLMSLGGVTASTFVLGSDLSAWSLALTLALAGLLARVRRDRHGLLAGILIALAFAARLDVGGYALLAALLVGDRRRVISGFCVTALPLIAVAVMTTPLTALYEQLIWFPLIGTRAFRALPPPDIASAAAFEVFIALVLVPKVAIAVGGVALIQKGLREKPLLVLVAFAALCQLQTLGRADYYHQAQAALPGYLVLGWLAADSMRPVREAMPRRRAFRRLGTFALAASACALSLVIGALSLPAVERGPLSDQDLELIAGIRTLRANTGPTEPIYVGLTEHRITFVNDVLVYYLADRRAGVRVAMFNPGVTNTDRVQSEMVADLRASRTSLLLLDERWAHFSEVTNDSAILGSMILDQYISATFAEVCRFGEIQIWALPDRAASVKCEEQRNERLVDIFASIGLP